LKHYLPHFFTLPPTLEDRNKGVKSFWVFFWEFP